MPGKYWNEEIETMSPGCVDHLESERLQRQMAYVYETSAYFRARFDQVGVRAQSIRHSDDLARLPFVVAQDALLDKAYALAGRLMALETTVTTEGFMDPETAARAAAAITG